MKVAKRDRVQMIWILECRGEENKIGDQLAEIGGGQPFLNGLPSAKPAIGD
jgi:hypothetical protein